MNEKIESTGLVELQSGAAVEMTNDALKEVFYNILDLNTDATAKRSVMLTIDITPDADRDSGRITIGVKKVLAPQSKQTTKLYFGKLPDGTAVAVEHNPRQSSLFGKDSKAAAPEIEVADEAAAVTDKAQAGAKGNVVNLKRASNDK